MLARSRARPPPRWPSVGGSSRAREAISGGIFGGDKIDPTRDIDDAPTVAMRLGPRDPGCSKNRPAGGWRAAEVRGTVHLEAEGAPRPVGGREDGCHAGQESRGDSRTGTLGGSCRVIQQLSAEERPQQRGRACQVLAHGVARAVGAAGQDSHHDRLVLLVRVRDVARE